LSRPAAFAREIPPGRAAVSLFLVIPDTDRESSIFCFDLKIWIVIPSEITGKVTRSPIDNRRMHINLELNNVN
jgi:hypothetical protein